MATKRGRGVAYLWGLLKEVLEVAHALGGAGDAESAGDFGGCRSHELEGGLKVRSWLRVPFSFRYRPLRRS